MPEPDRKMASAILSITLFALEDSICRAHKDEEGSFKKISQFEHRGSQENGMPTTSRKLGD